MGPKKPRGRWINYQVGGLKWSEMWSTELSDEIMTMIGSDSRRHSSRLHDISLRESFQMGADRRMQWLQVDTVTRARVAGADRMFLVYEGDPDMDVGRISVTHLDDCRVGRHRFDVESRFVIFELIFERLLSEGETYVYGFRVNFADAFLTAADGDGVRPTPVEATEGVRAFRTQSNAYVLRAHFDPSALPVQCYQVRAGRATEQQHDVREVGLSRGSAHIALSDVQPGVHGLRWDWE